MAASTATITIASPLAANADIDRADLDAAITDITIGDLSRSHVDSTATIPEIGTAAPSSSLVTGEQWIDTQDPDDAPSVETGKVHTIKTYNGATFRPAVSHFVSDTAPTFTQGIGMLWHDTTLRAMRVYDTVDGITGQHGVSSGVALVKNDTGGSIQAGHIVGINTAQTYLSASLPMYRKDTGVSAVVMEQILDGATGLCALISSGKVVTVRVKASTHAVLVGDGLVAAGGGQPNAESCGPLLIGSSPNVTAGTQFSGIPYGCFAVALSATTGTSVQTVTARLLGYVGQGADLRFGQDELATDGTDLAVAKWLTTSTWADLDLGAAEDTGDIIVTNGSAKHKPILGAYLDVYVEAQGSTTGTTTIDMSFGPNGAAVTNRLRDAGSSTSGSGAPTSTSVSGMYVPTAGGSGSYDVLGDVVTWAGTITAPGTDAVNTAEIHVVGYRY